MTEPTIIRASSLPNYPDCGLRWAAQNMRAEIEAMGWDLRRLPRGIGAANGTAVHKAGAHVLEAKIETGELGPEADAIEIGIDSLKSQADEEEIAWDDTTPERNTAEQQIIRQIRVYRGRVAPQLEPIEVEGEYRAEIKPGFKLSGHPDVLVPFDLEDLKTGRNQRANSAQYGAYSLLVRSKGHEPTRLIEDYVRRGSLKKPQPDPERVVYDAPRAERMADRIIRRIVADIERFRETHDPWSFLPNPNSYLCSSKWCPAHGTKLCGAWREE